MKWTVRWGLLASINKEEGPVQGIHTTNGLLFCSSLIFSALLFDFEANSLCTEICHQQAVSILITHTASGQEILPSRMSTHLSHRDPGCAYQNIKACLPWIMCLCSWERSPVIDQGKSLCFPWVWRSSMGGKNQVWGWQSLVGKVKAVCLHAVLLHFLLLEYNTTDFVN